LFNKKKRNPCIGKLWNNTEIARIQVLPNKIDFSNLESMTNPDDYENVLKQTLPIPKIQIEIRINISLI